MTIYRTPFGSFSTEEEAHNACVRADLDPIACTEIVRPDFTDVGYVTEYGLRQKLSSAVRVF